MANAVAEYLKKSINPGGTPRRLKEWMGAMLLFQAAATILPGRALTAWTIADISILSAIVMLVVAGWAYKKETHQVWICWLILVVGLILHVAGAAYYHTNRSDIVMICSWALVMFIAERRYYIDFSKFMYVVLACMLAMSVSTFITLTDITAVSSNAFTLMYTGFFTVVCNIYLLLVDFKFGKHQMDFFERHFDKITELSLSLSRILMLDKPIEQSMWDVTRKCIPLLGLDDFVIYLYDKDKDKLVQVAAYGQKVNKTSVINPIEIAPRQGIVGKAFSTRETILVKDAGQHTEYIVDDVARLSELAVPILIGDKVFGVIDSEHPQKDFYKHTHLQLFNVIAAFCSIKAAQHDVRSQQLEAEKDKLEVAKMKELEQFKSKFITNISHDLKTPLSLILGPANQIHNTCDDAFVQKQAMYIMKNTDHLMSMVEQLLQLNRIEKGIEPIHVGVVELNQVLKDMKIQYTQLAEDAGIRFDLKVDTGLLLSTDSFKLAQCVHNLLQNAFKYTEKGGVVNLSADRIAGNNVRIIVRDTGIGIAPAEQKKVFERFYKIDVNNHKGTGIGLSLVKEYVTQLQGKIELRSSPGVGSAFTITIPQSIDIPVNREMEIPASQIYTPHADDKKPLVLVVEDHIELNDFIAGSLQQNDYRCLQAYNGKDALSLMEQHLPDMVISDLMMPQMSGEELVATIKESDNLGHIPVIILTARNQVDNRVDLYQLGADNYIPKPFKMEELLAIVNNTLKQRKKLRDAFYQNYMPGSTGKDMENGNIQDDMPTPENVIIRSCMDYVLQHIDDPGLNVNTLGAALGLGRNRLQKEIKTATSLTPVEFIRSIRLHEAYKLMQQHKKYNISEIAYMTGFSNLSYFSRSFKMQFGQAPSEAVPQ